jgi:hypothetical protein
VDRDGRLAERGRTTGEKLAANRLLYIKEEIVRTLEPGAGELNFGSG